MMIYKKIGLVDTRQMLGDALRGRYAVPGFNFYNMETLIAIMAACTDTKSPVILQVSKSALHYMGPDTLVGMVAGTIKRTGVAVALHLDHGADFQICKDCIDMGFSSVMIDGSALAFDDNVALTKSVMEYARKHDVSVEAELGALAGIEDEVSVTDTHYTDPADAVRFVKMTGVDSLAISIGTSHGAYKMKKITDTLRFDILEKIAADIPDTPLVLHGASSVPQELVATINKFGGTISGARGIPVDQLRRATGMNICKINVDSDARLAFTAAVRESLAADPANFDPRKYLGTARDKMTGLYIDEIKNIMGSGN